MFIYRSSKLATLGVAVLSSIVTATPTANITRDVVVVGGGAAGAYAAFQLRDKYGKSIALIEKQGRLGGAVDSWTDPSTGTTHELGVEVFVDYGNATDFLSRLNISTTKTGSGAAVTQRYANFETGQWVNYTAPTTAERYDAFVKYIEQAEKYEDIMLPGFWNFTSPENIPEDLLLNFGDFVEKYGIQAAVPTIWTITALGLRDILNTPTFYVIQVFPAPMAKVYIGQNTAVHASNRNQDVYGRVLEYLGDDSVLLSSVVDSTERTCDGVKVVAKNENGTLTEIHARQLLIAIPPTLPNLEPFQLDDYELGVLSKTNYTKGYVGGVKSSCFLSNTTINNNPSSEWLDFPDFDFLLWFKNLGTKEGHNQVMMFGDEVLSGDGSKAVVQQAYDNLVKAGVLSEGCDLEWFNFADHGDLNVRVSADDLKAGFIQDLYSLQGRQSTWYTGAAWSVQLHTFAWAFSDSVIPRMLGSL